MTAKMKKKTAIILSTLAAVLALAILIGSTVSIVSCTTLEDEATFMATAEEQLKKAEFLNEVFFGEGLPYIAEDEEHIGNYYPLDEAAAPELPFSTIDEMRRYTEEVFSADYCSEIFQQAFDGVKTDTSIMPARYSVSDALAADGGGILVNSGFEAYDGMVGYTRSYDYSTLRIEKIRRHYVLVSISVTTVNDADPDDKSAPAGTRVKEIRFSRNEDGSFRINSSTY